MGRLRLAAAAALATAALCGAASLAGANTTAIVEVGSEQTAPVQRSIAVGAPNRGALIYGVQVPSEGVDFFTWDFPLGVSPNRDWRRWGTDAAVSKTLEVITAHRLENPGAPRVGVADLSRPSGGPFGRRYGGLGHASHQNGLDVDVLYPRRDHQERVAQKPKLIDRRLSQDLVDRFVAAGAEYVFVGPRTKLTGPKRIVQRLVHHDDHIHVRWTP